MLLVTVAPSCFDDSDDSVMYFRCYGDDVMFYFHIMGPVGQSRVTFSRVRQTAALDAELLSGQCNIFLAASLFHHVTMHCGLTYRFRHAQQNTCLTYKYAEFYNIYKQ